MVVRDVDLNVDIEPENVVDPGLVSIRDTHEESMDIDEPAEDIVSKPTETTTTNNVTIDLANVESTNNTQDLISTSKEKTVDIKKQPKKKRKLKIKSKKEIDDE